MEGSPACTGALTGKCRVGGEGAGVAVLSVGRTALGTMNGLKEKHGFEEWHSGGLGVLRGCFRRATS